MASDKTTIIIDADASGVASATSKAEQSLGKLGASVDSQSKNLNRYGEKLGKAFGPGQGLHGRLDSLEMPLRDTEGAFDRAQMAMVSFGNEGATASDKIGSGFLLAGDAIAAFTSGGTVGIAIVAAVAAFSLLSSVMGEAAEAAKEAEEATKKQAEALQNLAKSANAANVTISLLHAQTREKEVRERVRFIDEERRDVKKKFEALQDQHSEHLEELKDLENANPLTGRGARKRQLEAQKVADSKELKALKAKFKELDTEFSFSYEKISGARAEVEKEMRKNSEDEITLLIKALDAKVEASTKAIAKKTRSAAVVVTDIMTRYAAEQKAAEETQQALRKEDEVFEARQLKKQDAAKQRFLENQALLAQERIDAWNTAQAKKDADKEATRSAEQAASKRMAAFRKSHEIEMAMLSAATKAVIGGLQQMAHDGEISFAALGDAAFTAAGNELVAAGTKHLLAGAAKAFAGIASGNPVAISGGAAESGQGALMISAGLGLGAVGGAIGRSGGAPAASAPSTPTDTRESRNASGSGGGDGGTTIINFNGPAYDRRGVSQVITSGQRMAKHRRIAGA